MANGGGSSGASSGGGSGGSSGGGWAAGLGAAGNIIGGIGSLAGSIMGIIQANRESPGSQAARHIWERAREPVGDLLMNTFYTPALEGWRPPYTTTQTLSYAPRDSMKAVYSNFLNRQYGLPESVGQSMIAQNLQPLRMADFRGAVSANQVGAGARVDPQAIARAGLGLGGVKAAQQTNILKGAGQLSAFNLWRAQQLGQLIG